METRLLVFVVLLIPRFVFLFSANLSPCNAFSNNPCWRPHFLQQLSTSQTHHILFSGEGFANQSDGSSQIDKSYGKKALAPIKDLIDEEASMREFFSSNDEWHPLFRSIASGPSVPAVSFIDVEEGKAGDFFLFDDNTSPWRRRIAIPAADNDRAVLSELLDAMQTSLIDIPVDETTKDDDYDLHFIEEGRRLLVCSRFHVMHDIKKGSVDSFYDLFATCWSEIVELRQVDKINNGSLMVVPGLKYEDLRRFADINLQRPLQWLGIDDDFEVASLERGGLGVVRIIYRLSEIPTDLPRSPE